MWEGDAAADKPSRRAAMSSSGPAQRNALICREKRVGAPGIELSAPVRRYRTIARDFAALAGGKPSPLRAIVQSEVLPAPTHVVPRWSPATSLPTLGRLFSDSRPTSTLVERVPVAHATPAGVPRRDRGPQTPGRFDDSCVLVLPRRVLRLAHAARLGTPPARAGVRARRRGWARWPCSRHEPQRARLLRPRGGGAPARPRAPRTRCSAGPASSQPAPPRSRRGSRCSSSTGTRSRGRCS